MTAEPRMEDLLASIRKAIHEDIGEVPSSMSGQSAGTLYKSSMRELHVKAGSEPDAAAAEIQQLRERINRTRSADAALAPSVERSGTARQPDRAAETLRERWAADVQPVLRPGYAERDLRRVEVPRRDFARRLEVEAPAPLPVEEWVDEEPAYQAPPAGRHQPEPQMLSHESAAAAGAAFNKLADTILNRAASERSIEDMTRDLLRGMLKQWLDDNLPALVERLVREEIERVARHGR